MQILRDKLRVAVNRLRNRLYIILDFTSLALNAFLVFFIWSGDHFGGGHHKGTEIVFVFFIYLGWIVFCCYRSFFRYSDEFQAATYHRLGFLLPSLAFFASLFFLVAYLIVRHSEDIPSYAQLFAGTEWGTILLLPSLLVEIIAAIALLVLTAAALNVVLSRSDSVRFRLAVRSFLISLTLPATFFLTLAWMRLFSSLCGVVGEENETSFNLKLLTRVAGFIAIAYLLRESASAIEKKVQR